jgi:hypothetical protein
MELCLGFMDWQIDGIMSGIYGLAD